MLIISIFFINKDITEKIQGSKKVPSSCLGQVDFKGASHFHSHLPNGQGPRQVICQLNCKKSNVQLAQSKQNLRATCPKGKLEFNFFSSPEHSVLFGGDRHHLQHLTWLVERTKE